MLKRILGLVLVAGLLLMLGGCIIINGGQIGMRTVRGNRNIIEQTFTVDAENLPDFSTPPNAEEGEVWDMLSLTVMNVNLHNVPNQRGPEIIINESLGNTFIVRTDENLFNEFHVDVRENRVDITGFNRRLRSTEFTIETGLPFTHMQFDGVWNITHNHTGVPYAQVSTRGVVNGEFNFGALQDGLNVQVEGVGTVQLRGSAPNAFISVEGVANVRAFDFIAENAEVRVDGVGSVDVYATETLTARVRGVGTVRYDGGARVNRDVEGVGRVRAR
ncbi:MAG: DUF2807 domain-containing protein [Oscillospiraceae bacterium]|nr:DUF2807 domain-containing protein [Oscillospiraceae bacterium]